MLIFWLALLFAPICPIFNGPSLTSEHQSGDSSQSALRNKDVPDMLSAGLTSEIVIAKINSSRCDFDTSPDALKALRNAGVPNEVILAMVKAPTAHTASQQPEVIIRTAQVTCLAAKEVPLLPAPGDSHPLMQVRCGSEIFVLKEQTPWDKVRTPEGTVGYLSDFFVPKPASATASTHPSEEKSVEVSRASIPQNVIKAIAWRAVPWVTTSYFQTPGNSNTECTGSGSWSGNIWQGNSSCSTQYTPAQAVPINWQHVTVYNLVETSDARMVIACTRNWAFSKCSSLVPGNFFPFEYKKGKVELTGHKVGNEKEQTLSFDVVSSEQR
jgi:hypothetical protein